MAAGTKAIIFGGTSDIGSVVCKRILANGGAVHIVGRSVERTAELANSLNCSSSVSEAGDVDGLEQAWIEGLDSLGEVNAVSSLIGSLLLKPAHLISPEEWAETITTNLTSAFGVVRATAKHAKAPTSVVLMSTAAAGLGLANHEAFCAAKKGVEGLSLSAAASYASRGHRFNVVAPGLTKTKLTERITSNEKATENSLKMHPIGRLGEPADVASAVCWLLDPANSWVTGQVLAVDGGLGSIKLR